MINEYKNIRRYKLTYKLNSVLYLLISSLVIFLLCLVLSIFFSNVSQILSRSTYDIVLNPEVSLLQVTSRRFLSFTIDASLLRNMSNLPILNKKFINLAHHLSPAYVRFGGTSADCLFFNQTSSKISEVINPTNGKEDISNFTITEKDFLSLYEFTKQSNLRMLFDLNVLIREADGTWNSSEARKIILFAKYYEMAMDWQLGNEPPNFPIIFNLTITPDQLANDYNHLKALLISSGYKNSILVGPEVNQVGGPTHRGELYIKEFLKHSKNSVSFATWHQYYLKGEDAQVKDFINVSIFNDLLYSIKYMKEAINSSGNKIPMWLSETSTAYDGGTLGISDRFVAGFLWLDKLGYSAKSGIRVVIRQSFFGENYGMISSDLTPNPDWWVSVIFKKFVSNKVLDLLTPNNFGKLRLYAHCTQDKALLNGVPATTIFGVNINEISVTISIQGIPLLPQSAIFFYALTASKLQSRTIKMNGEDLKLLQSGGLPVFKPIILKTGENIILPAYSMVFIVVHGANVTGCW